VKGGAIFRKGVWGGWQERHPVSALRHHHESGRSGQRPRRHLRRPQPLVALSDATIPGWAWHLPRASAGSRNARHQDLLSLIERQREATEEAYVTVTTQIPMPTAFWAFSPKRWNDLTSSESTFRWHTPRWPPARRRRGDFERGFALAASSRNAPAANRLHAGRPPQIRPSGRNTPREHPRSPSRRRTIRAPR
jgi:hypothetical protein